MDSWMMELLRLSATASLTALVVLFARLLLARAPRVCSYLLWSVVFFRAVLPVSFTTSFSFLGLFSRLSSRTGAVIRTLPQPANGTVPAPAAMPVERVMSGYSEMGPVSQNIEGTGMDPWLVCGAVWLAGFSLLLGYSLYSLWRLQRMVRFAVRCEDGVYESDRLRTAFVLGFFRPRIYLPAGLSEKERRFIKEHERIHIHRHDHQWKMAAWLVTLLHWFNPVLWMSFRLMSRDMELSCDEGVLKNLGPHIREDYGDSLLALAAPKGFPAGATLAFGEGNIRARVKNVLAYRPVKPVAACGALLIVAATMLGCMGNPKEETQQGTAEGKLDPGKRFAAETAMRDADAVRETFFPDPQSQTEAAAVPGVVERQTHLELVGFSDNAPYYDLLFQKIEGGTGEKLLFPTVMDGGCLMLTSIVEIDTPGSLGTGYSYTLAGEEEPADTMGIQYCNWEDAESVVVTIDGLEYEVIFPITEPVEKPVNQELEVEGKRFVIEKAVVYPRSVVLELSGDWDMGGKIRLGGLIGRNGRSASAGYFGDSETGKCYLFHTFEDGIPQGQQIFRVQIESSEKPVNWTLRDYPVNLFL